MASTAAPLDLARLRLFVQVAEVGSLTKAAVMLDTAQPAISRQIAQLEREWGGRLFHRTGRGVAPTELGLRILPRAKALLAQAGELADDIKGTAGIPSGNVRIGVLPSLSQPLISLLFQRTRARFPKLQPASLRGLHRPDRGMARERPDRHRDPLSLWPGPAAR